ncbi:hypothetical protein RAD10_24590 [Bradyrhizobium sp. 23AC]
MITMNEHQSRSDALTDRYLQVPWGLSFARPTERIRHCCAPASYSRLISRRSASQPRWAVGSSRRDAWFGAKGQIKRIEHAEPYQESSPMRCPKCEADKWYEVATHDPWSGRPVIACKICGEYAELEALKREDAHDVITRTLAADLVGEGQADARAIASKVLQALENAGLTIRRS